MKPVYSLCVFWRKTIVLHFSPLTVTSPEASSTMRCCAASSGRAWSCITSNFVWSTFAAWTKFSVLEKIKYNRSAMRSWCS